MLLIWTPITWSLCGCYKSLTIIICIYILFNSMHGNTIFIISHYVSILYSYHNVVDGYSCNVYSFPMLSIFQGFFLFFVHIYWVILICTMMKPHFTWKLLVQNPCTLESSYTLGCMTIHPSCIEKHCACGRETLPNVWFVAS